MGKPLLTNDIIERINRGERLEDIVTDDEDTKEIHFDQRDVARLRRQEALDDTRPIYVEPSVTKSRRIENEKRSLFRHKVNRILTIIILLAIALILAMFYL